MGILIFSNVILWQCSKQPTPTDSGNFQSTKITLQKEEGSIGIQQQRLLNACKPQQYGKYFKKQCDAPDDAKAIMEQAMEDSNWTPSSSPPTDVLEAPEDEQIAPDIQAIQGYPFPYSDSRSIGNDIEDDCYWLAISWVIPIFTNCNPWSHKLTWVGSLSYSNHVIDYIDVISWLYIDSWLYGVGYSGGYEQQFAAVVGTFSHCNTYFWYVHGDHWFQEFNDPPCNAQPINPWNPYTNAWGIN